MRGMILVFLSLFFGSAYATQADLLIQLKNQYQQKLSSELEQTLNQLQNEARSPRAESWLHFYRALNALSTQAFQHAYSELNQVKPSYLDKEQITDLHLAFNYLSDYGQLPERKLSKLKTQLKIEPKQHSNWQFDVEAYTEYLNGITREEFKNPNVEPEREGRFRARTSAKVGYTYRLNPRHQIQLSETIRTINYEPVRTDLNQISHQFSTQWRYALTKRINLSQEYQFQQFFVGESLSEFLKFHQVESAVNYMPTAERLYRVGVRAKQQDLENILLDGEAYTLLGYAIHRLPQIDMDLIFGYQLQNAHARKKRFGYDQHLLMVGVKKTFWSDSVVRINASYALAAFGGKDTIQTNRTREDNKWSLTLKYIYPVGPVDLEVYANYTDRHSNLIRYDYDSQMYGLGVSWKYD